MLNLQKKKLNVNEREIERERKKKSDFPMDLVREEAMQVDELNSECWVCTTSEKD